jgi:hypothetical protein
LIGSQCSREPGLESQLAGFRSHLAADLDGNDGPLGPLAPAAAAGEPVADDGFGLARLATVAVGGVEDVDARLVASSSEVLGPVDTGMGLLSRLEGRYGRGPVILLASQRISSGCRES